MKILIVEDDKDILSFLKRGLVESGYVLDTASNGIDGEYLALLNTYDVIILDWMLPQKSGIDVVNSLRSKNITTPVLMLSAKSQTKDKVCGLREGCDDYLCKPFSFDELEARLESLYRRSISSNITNKINFKDIEIDIETKIVTKNHKPLKLSAKEYELLLFLIKHKNSFVSKMMIENALWSNEEFINSNVIQVTMHNLRKKISKAYIKSLRGLGYKLEI